MNQFQQYAKEYKELATVCFLRRPITGTRKP